MSTIEDIQRELKELSDRIKTLEDNYMQSPSTNSVTAAQATLNENKSAVINMILQDKAGGWRIALQKLLTVMFGASTLALSCAVGRKNSKYPSLDPVKLNIIKGI